MCETVYNSSVIVDKVEILSNVDKVEIWSKTIDAKWIEEISSIKYNYYDRANIRDEGGIFFKYEE